MSRPALEVAEIFRDRGPAWRRANAGHVSLEQLKVMSAIENCRTAALGGRVARCEDCAYTTIPTTPAATGTARSARAPPRSNGSPTVRPTSCRCRTITWCSRRRFLIHVLPSRFHRIRHYGLFAKSACADNIARARELLAVAKSEGQPAATTVDLNKPSCPCCGGRMIVIEVFERGATPRHRPTGPTNVIRIDTS